MCVCTGVVLVCLHVCMRVQARGHVNWCRYALVCVYVTLLIGESERFVGGGTKRESVCMCVCAT